MNEPDKLTPKERRMLELAAQGCPDKEIGKQLGLTQKTIRNYMSVIHDKSHLRSRLQVVLFYFHRGDIHPPWPDHDHRDRLN